MTLTIPEPQQTWVWPGWCEVPGPASEDVCTCPAGMNNMFDPMNHLENCPIRVAARTRAEACSHQWEVGPYIESKRAHYRRCRRCHKCEIVSDNSSEMPYFASLASASIGGAVPIPGDTPDDTLREIHDDFRKRARAAIGQPTRKAP